MEKLKILPQEILRFKCPDDTLTSEVLYNLRKEKWKDSVYNYSTIDSFLHKRLEYEKLNQWFKTCLEKSRQEMNIACEQLKITQCWANKSKINQWHHTHIHSNSLVSAIFYVTNSDACTWFSVKNIWDFCNYSNSNAFIRLYPSEYDINKEYVIHKQKTIAGELIIFPSSLYHSVDEHKDASSDRYSISFNSFPCGKIGRFETMAGLNIDVL